MKITNKEVAELYIKYKQQLEYFKQRQSLYDLNQYIEAKEMPIYHQDGNERTQL